ncbi:MORN repeat-containing protein 3 [Episyrphus balteatus]|uniref:MORN repeat-containing protein 3 n=1 Tax=Episyrphus balteatus TaxID=286459 RepID=UPI00248636A7|nr:MORN repeat-containing protein 3 [Episyrphus balteatus]
MKKRNEREVDIRKAHINGFRPFVKYHPVGSYQGCFHHSHFDGYGVKTFTKKNLVYDGQWKDSKCHGQGTLRKINQDGTSDRLYVGQWTNGKRCGEGKMFHKDGIYYGFWKDNKRSGIGIMWYKDGKIFLGEWKNGFYDGAGILMYANGNRYEGFFENGMKHGEGLYIHNETGQVQKGMWYQDVCKTSIMFDEFRNQAIRPTPYPIEEIQLLDPNNLVKTLFREYLPEPILKTEKKISCIDFIIKMRTKLLGLRI